MSFNIEEIIESKTSIKLSSYPIYFKKLFISFIAFILNLKEVEKAYNHLKSFKDFDFIDELFDYLDFSYNVSSKDKLRIPTEGKLVVISNHPLGALDGLALLKAISEVRQDVKVVANDILMNIESLSGLFLNYDVFSLKTQKNHIIAIEKAMLNDEAIIFFPAGEVSRFTINGIKDRKWQKGALRMAKKFKAPILPIFIKGRNSIIFYALSIVFKKLSIFLLPREIFNKKGYSITLKIGDPIPYTSINNNFINNKLQNNILRKHINLIGKNKSGIIKTEKTIIHPISVRLIKSELWRSEKLGFTFDGKEIWLVDGKFSRNIMKEITRLREITYRKVGEGTGKKADYDSFDEYFKHLVLWDDNNLEIVGAYRLGFCNEIIDRYGINGLYNSGQFNFDNEFTDTLGQSIELGRSFIQQKYWNSNALDYLWQGIGAVLIAHPEIRYLVGAVSISNSYSESAKALIVRYYEKWYSSDHKLVDSKCKFYISKNTDEEVKLVLNNNLMNDDFKAMKRELKAMGFSVPVLLRKYSEICSKEGVQFLDYGIDKDFSDSIDYFICLDMNFINQNFKERYYSQKSFVNQNVATN